MNHHNQQIPRFAFKSFVSSVLLNHGKFLQQGPSQTRYPVLYLPSTEAFKKNLKQFYFSLQWRSVAKSFPQITSIDLQKFRYLALCLQPASKLSGRKLKLESFHHPLLWHHQGHDSKSVCFSITLSSKWSKPKEVDEAFLSWLPWAGCRSWIISWIT